MPTALRSFAAWIAIACLAFGSLSPLAALAATKSPVAAMAICSTGTSAQTPGPAGPTGPAAPVGHGHCSYCSNQQSYTFDLPNNNVAASPAALLYFTAPPVARSAHPYLLRADSWARAPPQG